ncbi:hypothetical protein [Ruminococcus bicirculans (ex Wegman et al. 2014)]|nr:hypothetical protein [Ruminococcus bicirculans (ex Wegman et al. 2014)]
MSLTRAACCILEMVEYGDTKRIFTNPEKEATQNYITGRFG